MISRIIKLAILKVHRIMTGYVFENAQAIKPHLELPRIGPTSQFCSELAKGLGCYVIAGYPERLEADELGDGTLDVVGANSAVLCGPKGEWVGEYRKTNLFETDMSWAKAGSGFRTFDLPFPLRRVSIGICMDLNVQPPAVWDSLDGPYELASYTHAQDSDVLILLNAWLDSGKDVEERSDWSTLNFWAARLQPLWGSDTSSDLKSPKESSDSEDKTDDSQSTEGRKHTAVVVCNRSGEENGKTFAGSSALFSMRRGSKRPKLYDVMGRREEGVRIWTITV
ncbi:hypothetical protein PQX77_006090 [Marasmius sp. AFHP31]|nr:hypothetical protein PQX77_006090 [Marasmius sp. AFHP31]